MVREARLEPVELDRLERGVPEAVVVLDQEAPVPRRLRLEAERLAEALSVQGRLVLL